MAWRTTTIPMPYRYYTISTNLVL